MSVFLSLAPAWLDTVFYIYWFVLIIMLIMDDREPSITLAWLFILLFLPFVGVFFYIFFGRDWKVVAQRKGWIQTLRQVEADGDGPDLEAERRRLRALPARLGRHDRRADQARDHQREPRRRAAGVVDRALQRRRPQVPSTKEDLAGARRFIHLQYFIWEQDRLTAEIVPILLDRLEGGRRGPHHVRLDGLHHVQEGGTTPAQTGGGEGARPT